MPDHNPPPDLNEIIFEFVAVGTSVRVSAVDPLTGTEVVIVGPAKASRLELERIASRKLVYVLKQKRHGKGRGPTGFLA